MHTCALRENNNVFLLTQHFYLVDEVSIVLNPYLIVVVKLSKR